MAEPTFRLAHRGRPWGSTGRRGRSVRASRRAAALGCCLLLAACTGGPGLATAPTSPPSTSAPATSASPPPSPSPSPSPSITRRAGEFTLAVAGDVNFADRTADLLAADPATAFKEAAAELSRADLTVLNLETAITEGGTPENKLFHFRAPASAFTALKAAGVDVVSMANNHAADYGASGLADTLAAIQASGYPVIGIGRDADQAFAPYTTTISGVRIAIIGANQVQDETTLRKYSAGDGKPGVANAYDDRLVDAVRAARANADVVIVYLHWGIEYQTCPSAAQRAIADELSAAGAAAIVGTHAHVLQGAGWRPDGTYVAYGLSNYLWWMSFGNEQDDNGVLTLTFRDGKVAQAAFSPARLDERGVPMPATGETAQRINAQWERDRLCANLASSPPG